MRIAFHLGASFDPTSGGGFSFTSSIFEELTKGKLSNSNNYFFYYKSTQLEIPNGVNLQLADFENKKLSSLNNAIVKYDIQLVIFLTPEYEETLTPFISIVWDIEHRKHPFFPEVSIDGWVWEERELNFSKFLPKASYVITGTEEGKKEIEYFYRVYSDRVKVIPLPIPNWISKNKNELVVEAKKNLQLDLHSPYWFYPAQFWPHKNHYTLLKAIEILKIRKHKINLILCGSNKGNQDYIRDLIIEFDLESQVKCLNFVSESELFALYDNSVGLVFPSLFGPDNLPPLEAYAFGKPVIIADISGSESLLPDCVFFEQMNPKDLSEKILNLSIDQKNTRARNFNFLDSRSIERYVNTLFDVINEFKKYRRNWPINFPYLKYSNHEDKRDVLIREQQDIIRQAEDYIRNQADFMRNQADLLSHKKAYSWFWLEFSSGIDWGTGKKTELNEIQSEYFEISLSLAELSESPKIIYWQPMENLYCKVLIEKIQISGTGHTIEISLPDITHNGLNIENGWVEFLRLNNLFTIPFSEIWIPHSITITGKWKFLEQWKLGERFQEILNQSQFMLNESNDKVKSNLEVIDQKQKEIYSILNSKSYKLGNWFIKRIASIKNWI